MPCETESFFQNKWTTHVEQEMKGLKQTPPELIQNGPAYEQTTKQGEKLHLKTQFYHGEYRDHYATFVPCPPPDGHVIMHYLLANNEAGELVGTRISAIYKERDGLHVRSGIEVKNRGQGLASPIEDAFIDSLQQLANTQNKKVIWEVTDTNSEELEKQRATNPDPKIIEKLEEERQRWLHLYGEDGKYQIHKGKRIFIPEPVQS